MPRALQRGLAVLDLGIAIDVPPGGIPHLGRDVLERDGEVDNVEVEVVDSPICELFLRNWLDLLRIVERVPELGYDEQVLALHQALVDGAGDTLSGFYLISVVCCFPKIRQSWSMDFANVLECGGALGRERGKQAGIMRGLAGWRDHKPKSMIPRLGLVEARETMWRVGLGH